MFELRRPATPQPTGAVHRVQRDESEKRLDIRNGAALLHTSVRSPQRALHALAQQTMPTCAHLAHLARLPQMRAQQTQRAW